LHIIRHASINCNGGNHGGHLAQGRHQGTAGRGLQGADHDTQGDSAVGGVLRFRFHSNGVEVGGFDMKVLALQPRAHVLWEATDGPAEWIGTRISWDLKQDGEHVIVLFKHQGWKEPVEFMHHCSTKWAVFLMSLKSLLETGKGAPSPDDVKIDNWN
jgi:hypothetical protein